VCVCVYHTVFDRFRIWQILICVFPDTLRCDPHVSAKPSFWSDVPSLSPSPYLSATPLPLLLSLSPMQGLIDQIAVEYANLPIPICSAPPLVLGLGWPSSMLDWKHRRRVEVVSGAGAGIQTRIIVVSWHSFMYNPQQLNHYTMKTPPSGLWLTAGRLGAILNWAGSDMLKYFQKASILRNRDISRICMMTMSRSEVLQLNNLQPVNLLLHTCQLVS